jgi:hypothetical protein
LDILERTIKDSLLSKQYHKPWIEVGNYYLKWNEEKTYGIQQNEISEVKGFLKDAIPFFDASYEILNNLQKSNYKDKKYHRHKELFPCLCFSHRNKDHMVSYELHIANDGSTFLDRIEKIKAIDNNVMNSDNKLLTSEDDSAKASQHGKKNIIHLKWNLGELLFNRQGNDTQKRSRNFCRLVSAVSLL